MISSGAGFPKFSAKGPVLEARKDGFRLQTLRLQNTQQLRDDFKRISLLGINGDFIVSRV